MFRLDTTGADVRQEIRAGTATFLTMAYIIVVNPLILADAGMPADGVMAATCLAAALGCFLMGLLTNYPFALAPGMGLNAFFVYTVVLGMGLSWQGALAAVFISGAIFLLLTLTRAREAIVNAIPLGLKYAVSVGIGLFIALIGLKNAGIIAFNPGTKSLGLVTERHFAESRMPGVLPGLEELPGVREALPEGVSSFEQLIQEETVPVFQLLPPGTSPESVGLALFGLLLTAALVVRKVRGALLWGILGTTLVGVPLGVVG